MGDEEKRIGRRNGLLALLAIATIGLLIWTLSRQSNWYESDAANRSRYYARDAESQITNRCSFESTPDRLKCVDEAVDAAREHQRKEQDLAAQKVTAWWTRIMGGAAITGMVLSALGVYLVWVTFRETRKQAAAATSMLKLERARSASDVRLQIYFETQSTDKPQWITIVAKSHGGAEAMNVDVGDVTVTTSDDRFIGLKLAGKYEEGPETLSHSGASRKFQFSDPAFVFTREQMDSGALDNLQLHVQATLDFEDWAGEHQSSRQRWAGNVTTVCSPVPPYQTIKLQAALGRIE